MAKLVIEGVPKDLHFTLWPEVTQYLEQEGKTIRIEFDGSGRIFRVDEGKKRSFFQKEA